MRKAISGGAILRSIFISNITGREAVRLRSDIYWAARRWREASEQIELYYGDRWRDFKP